MQTKLQRGQKLCPCGGINAARQRVCKFCHERFESKNTPIKNEIKDWQSLEKGAVVKVIQGTGPYFEYQSDSKDDEAKAGDRVCLGNNGVFKVVGLDPEGIKAINTKTGVFTFLYMGPSYYYDKMGINREPHRIVRHKLPGERRGRKRTRNNN